MPGTYAFVDGMVSWGVGKVMDFGLGKFKGSKAGKWLKGSKLGKWATDSKFGSFVTDFALDIGKGAFKLQAKEFLTSPMKKWTMRTGPDGKQYSEYEKFKSDQKAGKVEYRVDKNGIIHAAIGRKSFGPEQLLENAAALIEAVVRAKPSAAKGTYLKKISLSTTMGPGIRVDPSSATRAA